MKQVISKSSPGKLKPVTQALTWIGLSLVLPTLAFAESTNTSATNTSNAVSPSNTELVISNLQQPLLFTGQISSSKQQLVSAPMTDRWQIQVQWMAEEGTIAKQGDLIVLFDAGSVKNQIQQNQEQLASQRLQLEKQTVALKQAVVVAEGKLAIAMLEVEKAEIEATIQSSDVSNYDKGRYKLALEKALVQKIKAEEELKVKQKEQWVGLEKQKIEITKIEETLAQLERTLERTTVKAQIEGQVSYMMHPWMRTKITAGTTVQQSMQVMLVQGSGDYLVKAWIHEIDVNKVSEGQAATVSLDAYQGQAFEATIVKVASQSEAKTEWSDSNYHEVQLKFTQQPSLNLLPGMSARVMVELDSDVARQESVQ